MELAVEPLETLEAPGFGEWAAGVGTGLLMGAAAVGVGALIAT